jgi:hypothetical protein
MIEADRVQLLQGEVTVVDTGDALCYWRNSHPSASVWPQKGSCRT